MPLPEPFFVIATQNPQEQVGTFPLPESQLDRFLMRVHLGYPAAAAERELLRGIDRRELVEFACRRVIERRTLAMSCSAAYSTCTSRRALLDYVQALVAHTRSAAGIERRFGRRAPASACCAPRAPGR